MSRNAKLTCSLYAGTAPLHMTFTYSVLGRLRLLWAAIVGHVDVDVTVKLRAEDAGARPDRVLVVTEQEGGCQLHGAFERDARQWHRVNTGALLEGEEE